MDAYQESIICCKNCGVFHIPVKDKDIKAKCSEEYKIKMEHLKTDQPLCCLPDCRKVCFFNAKEGVMFDFCGRYHAGMFQTKYVTTTLYRASVEKNLKMQQQLRTMQGSTYGGQPLQYTQHNNQGGTAAFYGGTSHQKHKGKDSMYEESGDYWCNTCYMYHNHKTDDVIRFYHKTDKYYEFTNFYDSPIIVDGRKWHTVEHFFQGQKYIGTPLLEKIRASYWPRDAFTISRSKAGTDWRRGDWEEVKIDVMQVALCAKFTQHGRLFDILKSTGDRNLVEHTTKDNFWGDGGNGSGQNMLGELLMEVRKMILQGKLEKSESGSNEGYHPWGKGNALGGSGQLAHHSSQSEATSSQSKGDNQDKEFSDSDHSSLMDEK